MSFNKTYRRGTIIISSQDVLLVTCAIYYAIAFGFLQKPMTQDDRDIGWLICAAGIEITVGWILQGLLKYWAPSQLLPQLLMVIRSGCRGVMYFSMAVLAYRAFEWLFY
jgi:hypothetical protein